MLFSLSDLEYVFHFLYPILSGDEFAFLLQRKKGSFRLTPNNAVGVHGDVRLHAFGKRRCLQLPDRLYLSGITEHPMDSPSSTPQAFVGIRFTSGRRWLPQKALSAIEAGDWSSIGDAFHVGFLSPQDSHRDIDRAKAELISLLSLATVRLEPEVDIDRSSIQLVDLISKVAGQAIAGGGSRKINQLNELIMVVEISLNSHQWEIIRLDSLMESLTKLTPPLAGCDGAGEETTSGSDQESCRICLEGFDDDQQGKGRGGGGVVRVRVCKHAYHEECMRNWPKRESTCPLCRADVMLPRFYK